MRKMIGAGLLIAAIVATPAYAGRNSKPFRVDVPSGISGSLQNTLWNATKSKCLELGYSIENEDRTLGTILCSLPSPMGSYTILVRFDRTGFYVTSSGTATRVPLMGGIMNSAKRKRREMISYLAQVAGVPEPRD